MWKKTNKKQGKLVEVWKKRKVFIIPCGRKGINPSGERNKGNNYFHPLPVNMIERTYFSCTWKKKLFKIKRYNLVDV